MVHKNEGFSGSVNSFHSGPILPPSSSKELSRNVFVVSVYAFEQKLPIRKGPGMMPKNDQHFRKSAVYEAQTEFWRPCRGLSPGKGFAPNKAIHYMTRRAFLALRVIQRHGKSSFNMLVKKWEKLMTKMKISQNL